MAAKSGNKQLPIEHDTLHLLFISAARFLSEKTKELCVKKNYKINEPKIPDLLKTMNTRKKNVTV